MGFLDAALGIDGLEVESSEILDKTTITEQARSERKDNDTSDFGIARKNDNDTIDDDTGKVAEDCNNYGHGHRLYAPAARAIANQEYCLAIIRPIEYDLDSVRREIALA